MMIHYPARYIFSTGRMIHDIKTVIDENIWSPGIKVN